MFSATATLTAALPLHAYKDAHSTQLQLQTCRITADPFAAHDFASLLSMASNPCPSSQNGGPALIRILCWLLQGNFGGHGGPQDGGPGGMGGGGPGGGGGGPGGFGRKLLSKHHGTSKVRREPSTWCAR